jgi:DNA-binding MarR family transcriptional regulator
MRVAKRRARAPVLDQSALQTLTGYALGRAEARFRRFYARAIEESALRPSEYMVLALIATNPGATPSDVAATLGIQRPNFVSLLARMQARGFVERTTGTRDRRNFLLYITPKGEEILAEVDRAAVGLDERMTRCWTEPERRLMLELLQRFYEQE